MKFNLEIDDVAIDLNALHDLCMPDETAAVQHLLATVPNLKRVAAGGRDLLFLDRGSSILGVAHVDTTMKADAFSLWTELSKAYVFNKNVDDRVGIFALLHLLPQLDVEADLLFTVGEEIGLSTAAYFEPPRQYNWMFQFDRGGIDAVTYQYNASEWKAALAPHFGKVGRGMCSDIAYLEHLGCAGVNIGTAYYDYTTDRACVSLTGLVAQAKKFLLFYQENKDTAYHHESWRIAASTPVERILGANSQYIMRERSKYEDRRLARFETKLAKILA